MTRWTPRQAECIRHRVEVLMDFDELLEGYDPDDCEVVVDKLHALDFEGALHDMPQFAAACIRDIVEGSTWYAVNGNSAAAARTVESVAERLGKLIGEELEPVLW